MLQDGVDTERPSISDLIKETAFLGTEFLTWLWWRAEEKGGLFNVQGVGDVSIQFVRLISLELGAEEGKELVTCSGHGTQMKEAKLGLSLGKKVAKATVVIDKGDIAWEATIIGKSLDIQGLKVIRGLDTEAVEDEGEHGEMGLLFFKLTLIKEFMHIIHEIYLDFAVKRMNESMWLNEKRGLSRWITGIGQGPQ